MKKFMLGALLGLLFVGSVSASPFVRQRQRVVVRQQFAVRQYVAPVVVQKQVVVKQQYIAPVAAFVQPVQPVIYAQPVFYSYPQPVFFQPVVAPVVVPQQVVSPPGK